MYLVQNFASFLMDLFILSVEFFKKMKIDHRLIECPDGKAGIATTVVRAFLSGQGRQFIMEYQPGPTAWERVEYPTQF